MSNDHNIQLCLPGGIGDISWVYSKIKHLKNVTGREVVVYVAGQDKPNRGGDLVQLLPEVKWGGYLNDRNSFNVIIQSIPADWPLTVGGIGLFHKPEILNLAANIHLESGRLISSWIPLLPTDYHYQLKISPEDISKAYQIMNGASCPIAVYLSNRSKEKQVQGGWNLWSSSEWIKFLKKFSEIDHCENATFIFLGAEYDRDKTEEVSAKLSSLGHKVKIVIGENLGVALECLRKSKYFFAYPSGIGILANVVRTPGVMMLPWILKGLEKSYADPEDLAYNRYKAWAQPEMEEMLRWVKNIGIPMSFNLNH